MVMRSQPQMVQVTLRVARPIAQAWAQFRQKNTLIDQDSLDGAALLLAMDADADSERKPATKAAAALAQDSEHDSMEVLAAMRYIARCRQEVELERWAKSGPECHAFVQRLRKRHQLKAGQDADAYERVFLNQSDKSEKGPGPSEGPGRAGAGPK